MPTYDPNTRFARAVVSVAPSPATSGTTLSIDVGTGATPDLDPPFYALVRPANMTETGANAETVLVTDAVDGTRQGDVTVEVVREGDPGSGVVSVDLLQRGDWDAFLNEQQLVTVIGDGVPVAVSSWALSFKGEATTPFGVGATSAAVQSALDAVSTIADYAVASVSELEAGGPDVNARQQILVFADAGTYTLALDDAVTGALAWNANDATVQAALEALVNVGPGNVSVTEGVAPGTHRRMFEVTFQNDLGGMPIPLLVGDDTALSGHANVLVTGVAGGPYTVEFDDLLGVHAVPLLEADDSLLHYSPFGVNEQVQISVNADGGSYALITPGGTTSFIAHNATAAAVQTALTVPGVMGAGNVLVTGEDGGPYLLEFVGARAAEDIGAITVTPDSSVTLNTRVFTIERAHKGSTAREITEGDTLEATLLSTEAFAFLMGSA